MKRLVKVVTVACVSALVLCSTEKAEEAETAQNESGQSGSKTMSMAPKAVAGSKEYKIELGGGRTILEVTSDDSTAWSCSMGGEQLSVSVDDGKYSLKKGTNTVASGTLDGGKLTLEDESGGTYLKLKFKVDKIKIWLGADTTLWELKRKENKYKVRVGDTRYGKVKYYPDNGKTKAKDTSESVVAESKAFENLSPALGAFLIKEADNERATFLAMVLMAHGG